MVVSCQYIKKFRFKIRQSGATFNRLDIALQQTSHFLQLMNQRMFGIQPHVSFNMGDDRNKAVVNQLPKLLLQVGRRKSERKFDKDESVKNRNRPQDTLIGNVQLAAEME